MFLAQFAYLRVFTVSSY